jgi:Ni2+-binding GTPase involved in maturation of urease and hydrogenase
MDAFLSDMNVINPRIKIFMTSAVHGEGIREWLEWLGQQLEAYNAG